MKKTLTFENWVAILVLFISIIVSIFYFCIGIMEDNYAFVAYEVTVFSLRAGALSLVSVITLTD
jgi:hypothetical protein